MRELLHPEVDFRGMTPNRSWQASDPDGVIDALELWFDDGDSIEELLELDGDAFADRERVGYRFRVRNAAGEHVVEQQAYLTAKDAQIGWLRIMCSGFRPVS